MEELKSVDNTMLMDLSAIRSINEPITFLANWVRIVCSYLAEGYPEKAVLLIQAIVYYIYFGKDPEFKDSSLMIIWDAIKDTAEPQRGKIGRKITARINGAKGGRPRKKLPTD